MNEHASITIEDGGTKVHADLGYAGAAQMRCKSELTGEIARSIGTRRLTLGDAVTLMGIEQSRSRTARPKASAKQSLLARP